MTPTTQLLIVAARPEPITIECSKTAVLVVDMQNDFAAPGGMFDSAGIDISLIRQALAPTQNVLAAARKVPMPIIYIKMEFQPDLSDFGAADDPNRIKHRPFAVGERMMTPDGPEGRTLIKATWNTEIVTELAPRPGDLIISKNRYSGFYQTDLHATLQSKGVRFFVFAGCTTSVCVESTLHDAMFRGYICLLLSDCTAEPIGSHEDAGDRKVVRVGN
jgi:ureidoacrylate peracid hydrolase